MNLLQSIFCGASPRGITTHARTDRLLHVGEAQADADANFTLVSVDRNEDQQLLLALGAQSSAPSCEFDIGLPRTCN